MTERSNGRGGSEIEYQSHTLSIDDLAMSRPPTAV